MARGSQRLQTRGDHGAVALVMTGVRGTSSRSLSNQMVPFLQSSQTQTSDSTQVAEWPSAHPGRLRAYLLPVSSLPHGSGAEWSVAGEVRPQAQARSVRAR